MPPARWRWSTIPFSRRSGSSRSRLGADLVMHSTTKYLNGHSDVVGGAVIAATAELQDNLAWWANAIGVTGAPFDSFLTLRGVRTLHARMRVHAENTAAVVDFLTRACRGGARVLPRPCRTIPAMRSRGASRAASAPC